MSHVPFPMAKQWQDDGIDRPSTTSTEPEHTHFRSRSTVQAQNPKRLSVFAGRSRSNTTSSFSRRAPGTSMSSVSGSPEERAPSAFAHREKDKPSRSFLARGSRILRRQGSRVNIVATLDEHDEIRRVKSSEKELFGRRVNYANNNERLKSLISDPFDFHHLTHTNPSQFQSLNQARQNDLVTEFSAIRASQRPQTDLKGIRAEDIHFPSFSAEDLGVFGTATTADVPSVSPPCSPPMGYSGHARKTSRANENFSRPAPRYPRSCPTTPPSSSVAGTPPLETVEFESRTMDKILGLSSPMIYPECLQSTPPNFFSRVPTDSSIRTSSMSSQFDLEDVPEEEEATRCWGTPGSSIGCPGSGSSSQASPPPPRSDSLGTQKRSVPMSISVAEELTRKFSEALGSPTIPRHLQHADALMEATPPEPATSLHRLSYADETLDSWDADIDYCYEHAAESTSNFDWSRNSLDESRPQISVTRSNGPWLPPKTRHLQPSPLSTSELPTPDLNSTPDSMPTHPVATPSNDYGHVFRSNDYFTVNTLGKISEPLYEDFMTADGESDRHFAFPGIAISPRNSFSPISKCNSQESLMLSRAASIARKHRSSVSTASVPELIHSLSSSRELVPTDRLTAGEALARPTSVSHCRTKSLVEAPELPQSAGNSHLEETPVHDCAKPPSDLKARMEAPLPPLPLPSLPAKNPNRRRKNRSPSYSLFPTAH